MFSSFATSVTPDHPRRDRRSSDLMARSTDWTNVLLRPTVSITDLLYTVLLPGPSCPGLTLLLVIANLALRVARPLAAAYRVPRCETNPGRRAGLRRRRWALRAPAPRLLRQPFVDRKSTRLNSSHANISYAVFCLKKKNK